MYVLLLNFTTMTNESTVYNAKSIVIIIIRPPVANMFNYAMLLLKYTLISVYNT